MKLFSTVFILLLSLTFSQGKMASTVKISDIMKVMIEEDSITIVGDAVYKFYIVTTEENQTSKVVISGQPTAQYVAYGKRAKFIIKPYSLNLNGELSEEEKLKKDKVKEDYECLWKQSVEKSKALKDGASVSISLQGDMVTFHAGRLISVEGNGHVISGR